MSLVSENETVLENRTHFSNSVERTHLVAIFKRCMKRENKQNNIYIEIREKRKERKIIRSFFTERKKRGRIVENGDHFFFLGGYEIESCVHMCSNFRRVPRTTHARTVELNESE